MNRKVFRHRQSCLSYLRRPEISLFCFVFGVIGVIFGLVGFLRPISVSRCKNFEVKTVSLADRSSGERRVGATERQKMMGFVGIQTGFASSGRRRSLRKTWMPSDHEGLKRLEESTGLVFRFVIGRSNDPRQMSELRKEIEEYDDFMLLDIEEAYLNLPHKTYEPLSNLLGSEYFLHAYGPLYALSAKVVENLVALRNDSLRMFSNKDVTIGAWMLAMNVYHEHNMALCSTSYSSSSIAVWDLPKCSGLFKPEEQLLALHQMEICSGSPTSG